MSKRAINLYEEFQDRKTFQNVAKKIINSILSDYGVLDYIDDVHVEFNHMHEMAGMDLVIGLKPKQVMNRHVHSYEAIVRSNRDSFEKNIENQAKTLVHQMLIEKLENSPYWKRKTLQFEQNEVEYRERIRSLQQQIAELRASIKLPEEQKEKSYDSDLTKRFKNSLKE